MLIFGTRSKKNRRNGAKSKGPVTAQGKARSSRNAIKHGLTAKQVVLDHEDPAEFERHRQSYVDDFHPVGQSEADLVETMAAARWRLNRLFMLEADLFNQEMAANGSKFSDAFKRLAESKSLSMYLRYESQLNRTYEKALAQLLTLQFERELGPFEPFSHQLQNEPTWQPKPVPPAQNPGPLGPPPLPDLPPNPAM